MPVMGKEATLLHHSGSLSHPAWMETSCSRLAGHPGQHQSSLSAWNFLERGEEDMERREANGEEIC